MAVLRAAPCAATNSTIVVRRATRVLAAGGLTFDKMSRRRGVRLGTKTRRPAASRTAAARCRGKPLHVRHEDGDRDGHHGNHPRAAR